MRNAKKQESMTHTHKKTKQNKKVNRNFSWGIPDVALTRAKTLNHVFKIVKELKETKYENNVTKIENTKKTKSMIEEQKEKELRKMIRASEDCEAPSSIPVFIYIMKKEKREKRWQKNLKNNGPKLPDLIKSVNQ